MVHPTRVKHVPTPRLKPQAACYKDGRTKVLMFIHTNTNSVLAPQKSNCHMRLGISFHLFVTLIFSLFVFCSAGKGSCSDFGSDSEMATLGGLRESYGAQNSAEVEGLGRFAVDEHNKKENAILEFARVLKAKEQVVSGTMHHLTIEAIDAGKKKLYDAKVWVKPWMNFKELQEFKHAGDASSFTPSDLGANRGGHASGWKEVPVHDPEVQNAADHALKTIQQRSNSLFPYELKEISHAKAEVVDQLAKFNLRLKVQRGNKEEEYNVEVHKDHTGEYKLNQMGAISPEY